VWFTDSEQGTVNAIGNRDIVLEQYRTPLEDFNSAGQGALGLAIDANGVVWCACGLNLVKIPGLLGDPVEYPIPDAVKPHGIIADDEGLVWIIDQHGARLHRFDPAAETFDGQWQIPDFSGGAHSDTDVPVDPHWLARRGNTIYFTGFTGVVGTFIVSREVFENYVRSPSRVSGVYDIAIDRAGRVWVTEAQANKLSRLVVGPQPRPWILPPGPPPIPIR
jgi:streptogramin lyase